MRELRSHHYPTSSRDLSEISTSSARLQRREPGGGGRGGGSHAPHFRRTSACARRRQAAPPPPGAAAQPGHAHLRRHFRGSPGADLGPRPGAVWFVLALLCFRPRLLPDRARFLRGPLGRHGPAVPRVRPPGLRETRTPLGAPMGPLPIRGEMSLPVTLGCRPRSTTEPGEAQEPAQEHRPTEWSLGQAAGHRQQLESGPLGAPGTVRPCSRLTCKMWAALVLVCISSLSLSECRVASRNPGYLVLSETQNNSVKKRASGETTKSLFNETSEETSTVAPSPATLARETSVANPGPTTVTARTAPRTDVGTSAATAGAPDLTASGVPTPWAPTAQPAPSATAALSTPSTRPGATPPPAAATTANASSPTGTRSPSEHTPSHPTASPTTPRNLQTLNTPTQGPALQEASVGPVTDEPIAPSMNTPPSVASVSTTVVTATKSQAKGPAVTTVPHASSTLPVGATSPTTQPSPASSSWGPTGPGTPQTPEQGQPEATSGTAPTEPTAGNSEDSKVPATDSCQLSTQGQYLVVTTRPLMLSVNRSSLLAVLLLGVTLFFTVLVLFALQAYESYRKKGYTQVDYLINGMYADSEM